MAGPTITLDEQLADQRSNQIAYKLTLESSTPVNLISIEPRIPLGAHILEITDSSLLKVNAQRTTLLSELNDQLSILLWLTSSDLRKSLVESLQETVKETFSVTGILRFYFQFMIDRRFLSSIIERKFRSRLFTITSLADAEAAHERWVRDLSLADMATAKLVFEGKIQQLKRLESSLDEKDRHALANVGPDSPFTATYVIRFDRHLFEPSKYHISFGATYSPPDATATQTISASANVQISPYPSTLSIVAIGASFLGILLKSSLSSSGLPIGNVGSLFATTQTLIAPIVALIFFNIYEHTTLGKDLKMPLSWRSALLIGALCGLAHDRILESIKALLGIQ